MASRKSLAQLQAEEQTKKQALAKKKTAYDLAAAALREAETKTLNQRRYQVGRLVLDHAPLADLSLEELQEALTCLAVWVQDVPQYQAFVREHRETSVPSPGSSSNTGISGEIRETAQNGSRT